MFKGPDGKIHEGMKQKYGELQEGYRNEVVPYKNKAINEFMRGESSPDELVNSLSKRAFYAKRGKYHNAMRMRKLVKSHPYLAGIGTGSALGAGALGFYNELFGKSK
jgi:4-diphosphocytidyl-2C-methyl-D-erythritol kinase